MLFVVPATLALLTTAAWAGHMSRPDLVDIDDSFVDSKNLVTENTAYINVGQPNGSYQSAEGELRGTASAGGVYSQVTVWWDLYEADKVTRKDKDAKLDQKKWLQVGVSASLDTGGTASDTTFSTYVNGSSATSGGVVTTDNNDVEKCKAQVSAKAVKPGGRMASLDSAKWKVDCQGALTAMNLPSPVTLRLVALLDKKLVDVEKDKIKIKGQCKAATCINPNSP
jgi:hypothetical protein